MNIVILDYGLCNLLSVYNALLSLGIKAKVSDSPSSIIDADRVILPGVGAFRDGMNGLNQKQLIEAIHVYVNRGKPLLGICLGMQMLFDSSEEFGLHKGLGLIPGRVVSLKNCQNVSVKDFRVPHIGWNSLNQVDQSWQGTILEGIPSCTDMYFVHSYYGVPDMQSNLLASTNYGGVNFCSVVASGNIYGCQFHPEKSARLGLKILNNFINLKNG